MTPPRIILAITVAMLLTVIFTSLTHANDELVEGYVTDSQGNVFKNSYGECWRDRFAATTVKLEECGYPPAPAKCPAPINTQVLLFAFDSDAIRDADKNVLLNFRDYVAALDSAACFDGKTVSVIGHTDSIGTEQYNQDLSINRALSVVNFLIGAGLSTDTTIGGYGEHFPIENNNTEFGRMMNRRVELDIKSK